MRISLVHYSAPPVIGGVERVLAQQAQTLARHGHQAVVVCATKGAKVDGAIMEYAPNFYIKRVLSALAGSRRGDRAQHVHHAVQLGLIQNPGADQPGDDRLPLHQLGA